MYLIDTNIAIFYMKGKFPLDNKFEGLSADDCFISEITLAELKLGTTSVVHKLVMVTNNTVHFQRIKGISLEDWPA